MFCKNCGAEIADNATFCPKCGGKVDQASTQGNPIPPQNNQPYGGYQGGGYQSPVGGANKASGKVWLIVGGILLIIVGVVGLANGAMSLGAAQFFGLGGIVTFELICAILWLVTGICALAFCGKKDKGNILFVLGIILIVLRIIDMIWAGSLLAGLGGYNVGGAIFGIIILAVVAIGGYLNSKS